MKEKEFEKKKEKIMKLIGLPLSKILLHGHDQSPLEITNSHGSNLIPRIINTNIMVYILSTDLQMGFRRHHADDRQHGARANDVVGTTDLDRARYQQDNTPGNLPLHLAIENGDKEVALLLVKENPRGSYALNCSMISPLYLAVQRKDLDLVKNMLSELVSDNNALESLKKGKSIVRAAIDDNNQEMLEIIFNYQRELIRTTDEEGLTPLSYAASNNSLEMVHYLITKFPRSICYSNDDKSNPIQKACLGGHVKVLQMFYSQSPNSLLTINHQGQTLLHLAAKERGNKLKHVVSYLLSIEEGRGLIKKKDENGRTPLDVARNSRNREVEEFFRRISQ